MLRLRLDYLLKIIILMCCYSRIQFCKTNHQLVIQKKKKFTKLYVNINLPIHISISPTCWIVRKTLLLMVCVSKHLIVPSDFQRDFMKGGLGKPSIGPNLSCMYFVKTSKSRCFFYIHPWESLILWIHNSLT